eukprot:scaffold51202_cov65-Phaeocystis_antarctica.AAC.1
MPFCRRSPCSCSAAARARNSCCTRCTLFCESRAQGSRIVTTRRGQKHIKTRNKSETSRPRAVRVDPGHGPGEVSPDLGLTPGQAYEV